MRPGVAPHDVARVEVAVQAQARHSAQLREGLVDASQRRIAPTGPERALGVGHEVAVEQALARRMAKGHGVHRAPMQEGAACPHRVQAAKETAQPLQGAGVFQLGCTAGVS